MRLVNQAIKREEFKMSKQLFKAGDEVEGIAGDAKLREGEEPDYPLDVWVNGTCVDCVTTDGFTLKSHKFPVIWHKKTGSAPVAGDRPFEYPLYMTRDCGCIFEYTSLHANECIKKGGGCKVKVSCCYAHTADFMIACEKPKLKPEKPTWCLARNEGCLDTPALITCHDGFFYKSPDYNGAEIRCFKYAEPCEDKDIPQWWKDMQKGEGNDSK